MRRMAKIISAVLYITSFILIFSGCKKTENPIKFPKGTFPDSVLNISGINSVYDDFNMDIYVLSATTPLVFSSNRGSSGGQFDLVHGTLSYVFCQETGDFVLNGEMTNDVFLDKLVSAANTTGDDFGPCRLYSPLDGYEYLIVSSVNTDGNLDLFYIKNLPYFGTKLPEINGPYPVRLFNSGSDDAYICFDTNQDSAYFSSNRDGDFDIFLHKRPAETNLDSWFDADYSSPFRADSINSTGEDKCPFIYGRIMVFASDRPEGTGGYDLYYSVFRNGKWSSPVNFGPDINTPSDEYRPVLGSHDDFTNLFMIFSSNRHGGKGGFDLYFTGVEFSN